MSEIIFGTQEHIAGLSRDALEADFRYVQDRRMELEEACERLRAENNKLRELVDYMTPIAWYGASERERDRMRELGVEVDA